MSGSASLQVRVVVEAEEAGPGGQVGGDVRRDDPAALTCQDFDGRFRRPMALAVRTPAVSTTACSRCTASMYWGWWLPGTPAIPAVRDVRAGDRVPPAGLPLVVGQVPHVAAGRLHPAGDPPQAVGPVPGAAHQAGDLGDVLVLLGGAVLGGAGLPRACGDLPDRVLVGGGDHPPAGEQHFPPRRGQGQQVLRRARGWRRPRRRGRGSSSGTGPGPAGSRRPARPCGR